MPYIPPLSVIATQVYVKRAKRLMSGPARQAAELSIAVAPERWPVVAGTAGCRKARISLEGRGKRGGGRVIYFFATRAGAIYLLDVYAKNEKEDLTRDDKKALHAIVKELSQTSA